VAYNPKRSVLRLDPSTRVTGRRRDRLRCPAVGQRVFSARQPYDLLEVEDLVDFGDGEDSAGKAGHASDQELTTLAAD